MKNYRVIQKTVIFSFAMLVITSTLRADTRVPTAPLEERVKAAEVVFVGKLIDKKVQGDWATAKLLVKESLHNVKVDQTIEVTWRIQIDNRPIYDVAEGTERIAILKDKHKGRYWLRTDKFEGLEKLDKVKQILKKAE
ncbi:MAG: hypothetical protein AB8C95_02565 [Phycisphaeraceae bacterium]